MEFELKPTMRIYWKLMKPFVKLWIGSSMHPVVENRLPADLKPPYLVLSNHVHVYDGVMVILHLPHLPVTVLTDFQNTDPSRRKLFTSVGAIFKPLGVADAAVIRKMIKAKDAGRSLLLFPEGEIARIGDSKQLEGNLARLVRLLGLPVVVAKLKGVYVKQPYWANFLRSGKCKIEYDLILKPEEIRALSDADLLSRLSEKHSHSEIDWLASEDGSHYRYGSDKPAKGLENLLFCCPSCKGTNCMEPRDDKSIKCSLCGYSAGFDARLRLQPSGNDLIFKDMREWYTWQKDYWRKEVLRRAHGDGIIMEAVCPDVKGIPINGSEEKLIGKGPAVLMKDGISYFNIEGDKVFLPIEEVLVAHATRSSANKDYWLLIRTKDNFLMFTLTEPNLPVLAWELAIPTLRGQKQEI